MSKVHYIMARPSSEEDVQLTMLAPEDESAGIAAIVEHAKSLGWEYVDVGIWVSDSSGDQKMPDGKDVFRLHQRTQFLYL